MSVKAGLLLPTRDYAAAKAAALQAEAQGFWSVSLNDHFVSQGGGPQTPQLECLSLLTAIAAVTERVRILPAVIAASYRTPAMLAKAAATIDQISGGRFVLANVSGDADRVGEGVTSFIVVATSPETQRLLADEVLPAL